MLLQDDTRKRVPHLSISFREALDRPGTFAEEWFFWVHDAFKPALDIAHIEIINSAKTEELRNKHCVRLYGMQHKDLIAKVKASGELLKDSDEHQRIMAYSHKDLVETEGSPALYAFRETDSFESRCGDWYVQITQASPARLDRPGEVGFQVYGRNTDSSNLRWKKLDWYSTTQAEFVHLLRIGACSVVNLVVPFALQGKVIAPTADIEETFS